VILTSVLDFQVKDHHLRDDNIHIDYEHRDLVENSIFHYFKTLTPGLPSPTIKKNVRSSEALARHNIRQFQKLTEKQQRFHLQRSIIPPWILKHAKQYLRKQEIKFAKLPPIKKNILRIQFNNSISLPAADKALPQDVFSKENYFQHYP
jgi:hypothetical protein